MVDRINRLLSKKSNWIVHPEIYDDKVFQIDYQISTGHFYMLNMYEDRLVARRSRKKDDTWSNKVLNRFFND